MLYAGIDGGQSSTVAAIGDGTRMLGRGSGPPADLVGQERDSPRQRDAIEHALVAALADADLAADTRFDALVAGISGFDDGLSVAPEYSRRAERVRFVHDTVNALAGALDGAPGIVAIAGTGSVALGNDADSDAYERAGGWGYFFGDEGGAIWIARSALRRAMARADRAERSELGERACTFFGATSLRQIQHGFAHGDLTNASIAAFACDVLALADDGEPDAIETRVEATRALADLCATIDARLARTPRRNVSYTGGLFENTSFEREFVRAVVHVLPSALVSPPKNDAAIGALVLARTLGSTRA